MSTPTRHLVPRTSVERRAARHAREIRLRLAADLRAAREDAGLSLSRLARACGLTKSHVHAVESARIEFGWEALSRIATVLGGELGVRYYQGTGRLIRDHIQTAMIGALLAILHERWRPRPEVAVHRPVRGVIDLVLDDMAGAVCLACEAQSELRRLEQQIRWAGAKADALRASRDGGRSVAERRVSRVLLLRSTQSTRAVVAEYADLLAAAYSARATDAYRALTSEASWPGDALLWCHVVGDQATVLDRSPRGIRVGR